MKIFLLPLSERGRRPGGEAYRLEMLARRAVTPSHTLVDRPEQADVVLLTDLREVRDHLARTVLFDPRVRPFRSRALALSEEDWPLRAWPGLFASMRAGPLFDVTYRTVAFPCWLGASNAEFRERSQAPVGARHPDLLYSYQGRNSAPVRQALVRALAGRPDGWVKDTSDLFNPYRGDPAARAPLEREYLEVALRSKFALCPRGAGLGTLRLYEMLALGVAPVILADRWRPPLGPDWESFALFVPEREVADLPEILARHEHRWEEMGRAARRAWDEHFAVERRFDHVGNAAASLLPNIRRAQTVQMLFWPMNLLLMPTLRTAWGALRRGRH